MRESGKDLVLRTKCSIYGLGNSAHAWFTVFEEFLLDFGFKVLLSESCFYVLRNKEKKIIMMLLLYVDDILYSGNEKIVKRFETELMKKFKLNSTIKI